MTKNGISELLIDWVEDMLARRNLLVEYNITIQDKPDRSCPQGAVLSYSALLWIIY